MPLNRRQFNRLVLLGGTSFASMSKILFPKPAESYQFDIQLENFSANKALENLARNTKLSSASGVFLEEQSISTATIENTFDTILQNTSTDIIGATLPPIIEPEVRSAIQEREVEFERREFTVDRTPFAQAGEGRLDNIIWGRERQETLGQSPGFSKVQMIQGEISTVAYSGPTTVGIDSLIKILASERLSPSNIGDLVLPWRSQFEDWSTWEGDADPADINSNGSGISFVSYLTRFGEVLLRYEAIDPQPGGFGVIHIVMEGELQPRRDVVVTVKFSA